jgi:hypothetical protein
MARNDIVSPDQNIKQRLIANESKNINNKTPHKN